MAKSTKEFTTWEGGISNATEPSDVGDDTGSFSLKNLDGTLKMGVLQPCGTMLEYPSPINAIDQSDSQAGDGFQIMPTDHELGGNMLFETDASSTNLLTKFNTANIVGANTFTSSGYALEWQSSATGQSISTLELKTSEFQPEDGKWYQLDVDANIMLFNWGNGIGHNCYFRIHEDSYGTYSTDRFSNVWNDLSYASGEQVTSTFTRVSLVWKSDASALKLLYAIGGASGVAVDRISIRNISIFELPVNDAHELQFLQTNPSGTNLINIYQDGKNGAGTMGSPYKQLNLGAASDSKISYLKSANATRISDGNFNNDTQTKFFGFIDRQFFKEVYTDFSSYVSLRAEWNNDNQFTKFHRGIKRKLWIDEDAKLTAPNPLNCTMPCMGDMVNRGYGSVAEDQDFYWHADLLDAIEVDADKYHLRLEYKVKKDTCFDQSGTWNAAEDGQDGTLATSEEKGITYHFYCSFVYDRGAQESELTQITQIQQQGLAWDTDANNPAQMHPSGWSTNGDLNLYYHDQAVCDEISTNATHLSEALCDAGAGGHSDYKSHWVTSCDEFATTAHATVGACNAGSADHSDGTTNGIGVHWPGEAGQRPAHVGSYDIHPAWDCALGFRATIMVSNMGSAKWNLPERCTGVNWYYSSSDDAHNKKYRLVEADFKDGIKYKSSDTEDWLDWKTFAPSADSMGKIVTDAGIISGLRWFYSHNEEKEDGTIIIEDPPEGEHWDGIYGMKSSKWAEIRYKSACIIGGQAFYGHVAIDGEVYKDRVLVSMGGSGYDMIPHDNFLEVVSGDGDEIIQMLPYQNQLYVFKRNKVIVCDVGGEEDKIASEHLVGGIATKHQCCVTSKGVFWFNTHGAYLSTGGEASSLVLAKIDTEQRAEDVHLQISTTAGSATVNTLGKTHLLSVGMEQYGWWHQGGYMTVESIIDANDFTTTREAWTTGTATISATGFRQRATDCVWSIRESDIPVVGYNPREEQIFILSATKEGRSKHFWKYDLKDESWWYQDADFFVTATNGISSSGSTTLTYDSNDLIKPGMKVWSVDSTDIQGNGHVGTDTEYYVASVTSDTECELNIGTNIAAGTNTLMFSGGPFKGIDRHSNFTLDINNQLCILSGVSGDTTLKSSIKHWDKTPAIQNIFYETGLLDFGSPSTWKQLYKVTIVAKNATSNIYAHCSGISPEQAYALPTGDITVGGLTGELDNMDAVGSFGLVNPNALNTTAQFRASHHKVYGQADALWGQQGYRAISAKGLFFNLLLINEEGYPVPSDFQIHSITFVYRDRGITV